MLYTARLGQQGQVLRRAICIGDMQDIVNFCPRHQPHTGGNIAAIMQAQAVRCRCAHLAQCFLIVAAKGGYFRIDFGCRGKVLPCRGKAAAAIGRQHFFLYDQTVIQGFAGVFFRGGRRLKMVLAVCFTAFHVFPPPFGLGGGHFCGHGVSS